MKHLSKHLKKSVSRMSISRFTYTPFEVYEILTDIKEEVSDKHYLYEDTIQILLNMIKGGDYDPNNYYHTDEISKAEQLIEEK